MAIAYLRYFLGSRGVILFFGTVSTDCNANLTTVWAYTPTRTRPVLYAIYRTIQYPVVIAYGYCPQFLTSFSPVLYS